MEHGTNKGTDFIQTQLPEAPQDLTYHDLMLNASLYFVLRLPVVGPPRSLMPNIIDIGSIMARPANSSMIDPDLRTFVDKATKGFVIVSFGSWLDFLPESVILKMVDAFAKFHLPIIWKLTKSQANLSIPDHVKIVAWLPQNDLLGHKHAKAFVTHCGASSVIETLYHGIPIVAFPIAMDQSTNSAYLEDVGVILTFKTFTADDLLVALNAVTLDGNRYKVNVEKVSAIMKDLPDAGDTASFWISHVIKHGRRHLRSNAFDLYWYEFWSLDVIAIISVSLFVVFKLLKILCIFMYTIICCRKHSKEKND